ncbi:DNA replication/repair protein RecF [Roseburia inulinivorans]|jgi:DNA replication and repair protein RecF|uniref:DNA replication and repair protein RecF n=1 Tax=Roseburia inulinivorans TaxID=360807 RepID=A0A3R6JY39_9FIRM|nr:DNA replication/repair protein RecF [Roseburia inulinivorans]RHF81655.1 DNA replication/repair protein RecF [Roseburia inulinivorans]
MIIKSIELQNFRNYEDLNISFDEGTNIFYGDNAQGKTNILEAAYLSGTTKSHKCSKDKEMIRFGEQESHIRTVVVKKDKEYQIDMHLKNNRSKGIAINKVPIKKASELFGILNMVFFSPEDLNIIKNGPAERRRFLDSELCQLDKIYLSDLTTYNKILNQRNKLLKDMVYRPDLKDTLPVWDMQLVETGRKIIRRRKQFVDELNEIVHDIHYRISGEKEDLLLQYEPSIEDIFFEDELSRVKERDMRQCMTSVGPHRDDLLFSIGEVDIRKFGSQGQQRTSALSLKLSEIELVKRSIHDTPVLLLDDVLSELDSNRQNYLLNSIHDTQTLITCTGLDEFVKNRFQINKIFKVVQGTVEERKEL